MLGRLAILTSVIIILSFIGQQLADKHSKDNESFRKLFHIMHGVAVAGLAFVVPLDWLIGLEVLFFVSMIITRYLVVHTNHLLKIMGYFSRAYKVGRISYGEFFYPISVILLVLFSETKWEFAAAVLILGLADALAALVGKKYGRKTTYLVLGQKKSLIGSTAFFIVTVFVLVGFVALAPHISAISYWFILPIALLITLTENVGVYGTDNLLIPIAAILLLNAL
jgi:phytol kinase